jgi:hypothetical protein
MGRERQSRRDTVQPDDCRVPSRQLLAERDVLVREPLFWDQRKIQLKHQRLGHTVLPCPPPGAVPSGQTSSTAQGAWSTT